MIMFARTCASIINCQLSIINYHCSSMSKIAAICFTLQNYNPIIRLRKQKKSDSAIGLQNQT